MALKNQTQSQESIISQTTADVFVRSAARKKRRGSVLLEFILAFPIILIMTLAIMEFSLYSMLQQTITTATVEGARESATYGSTTNSVGNLIHQYLAINSLNLDVNQQPASPGAGNVLVIIQKSTNPTETMGNSNINGSPVGPTPSATETKVTVCVNLTDSSGSSPLPDLLSSFGFSLTGKRFEISALAGLD
ncbi:TadE/TadG family type IV pilus assembly protein [Gimesia sp.]|uniref:TadE/TadG family type IV pilus assembly protein n=1 Tax=Gimesia sp. TaxID=2024833 RepID=UPI003A938CEC